MTEVYEGMKTERKQALMDHLCPHHRLWDAFYACSHFIDDASRVQCLADLPTGTQLFPGGSRIRGYHRPLIPNLTHSTAPSFPQSRVGRGRGAPDGNCRISYNLILQVAACRLCSHSRGGDNRMAWMQGGGITGAHFKGCLPHPEFCYCSCSLYFSRMGRSRREGGIFEKQNPTGLNVLFAITFDIASHTTWYLSIS